MSRRIGIASAIWGASILLSRVVGLAREALIGRTLGSSPDADAYFSAFTLPDFLNYLLAGGALSIVFIPIFAGHLARGEVERGWQAFSAIATLLALLLVVFIATAWVLLPALASIVAPGFTPDQHALLVDLTRIVLFAQVFHVLGGLLSAVLQARDEHWLPALAPLVYNGCTIAGGVIGGASAGAHGFAWGILAGSILGPFGLPLAGCLRAGMRWRVRWAPRDPDLVLYLMRSLPIMLGFSIVVADDWFLRREASLVSSGAVSTLAYAKSLMRVPMGVFGLAAGVAAFPTLSRLVAEGRTGEMARTLGASARRVLVLACGAQAVLSVSGRDVAALVYGQRALAPAELDAIGSALTAISLGLCAWSVQPLLARGFYALGNTWLPAATGTAVAVASYPLYMWGRATLGTQGLAWASSAAILAYTAWLAVCLARRLPGESSEMRAGMRWSGWPWFGARLLGTLLGAIAIGRMTLAFAPRGDGAAELVLRTALVGAATLAGHVACARVLGIWRSGVRTAAGTRSSTEIAVGRITGDK